MLASNDTIYALSSGSLPAGVAVVRMSGPRAFTVAEALCGPLPDERRASLRTIRDRQGMSIDEGLVLTFVGPRSFTGEDSVELQVHGGRAVVQAILREIGSHAGCRLAEAGEFSRRAFENGKLDLLEIEGLADLLAAETEMQRRLSKEYASGGLSRLYNSWRDRLLHARAMIEAELDFSDEEDIPGSVSDQIWPGMTALEIEMREHLSGYQSGEIIRDGFKVALVGAPNAGKSSLLNALARREIAIVTEHAGTTRDILHCDLDIGGYLVKVFDTAGIRDTIDAVEVEGIRRAKDLHSDADLLLILEDVTEPGSAVVPEAETGPRLRIGTKIDRLAADHALSGYDHHISSTTGEGLAALKAAILDFVVASTITQSLALPSRTRHVRAIEDSMDALSAANVQCSAPIELRAEYLRQSSDFLGRLTGRIDTEMLLGAIFSEFCVGK